MRRYGVILCLWIKVISVLCYDQYEEWMHSEVLDQHGYFKIRWSVVDHVITFETVVRTLGYIGLGLSKDGNMAGSDIMLGWVKNGRATVQDRFATANKEPDLDSQQDWQLLYGSENDTHTVLRFRRVLNTCDEMDIPITNDTYRLIYAYHEDDPEENTDFFQYHGPFNKGSRSIYLLDRVSQNIDKTPDIQYWDLRNPQVLLPADQDTLYWCKVFKLPPMTRKHHMIRYEPLHQLGHERYLHHIIVYECSGNDPGFENLVKDKGHRCYQPNMPPLALSCNTVIAAWAIGSEGLTLPVNTGYPLDPRGTKYFLMETHYDNSGLHQWVRDSSGIRILYTHNLRQNEAGVLSLGIDPNWKHLIPPRQPVVVSEGHCISQCTRETLPDAGVEMFAVILHSHLIGKRIRLRHIRDGEELSPIAQDGNYDFNYQEYRQLMKPRRILPGDHLITECTYNSSDRPAITLGGFSTREEMCLVFGYYTPRVDLSMCHSIPSLPTILNSLGIQELWPDSNPVKIKSPSSLNNMSLEDRLITYNWEENFDHFQQATHSGTYRPYCWKRGRVLIQGTEAIQAMYPTIDEPYVEPDICGREEETFVPVRSNDHTGLKVPVSPNVGVDRIQHDDDSLHHHEITSPHSAEFRPVEPEARPEINNRWHSDGPSDSVKAPREKGGLIEIKEMKKEGAGHPLSDNISEDTAASQHSANSALSGRCHGPLWWTISVWTVIRLNS